MSVMRFPECCGDDLTRAKVCFPRDFAGLPTLAIVAFDVNARAALESWLPYVEHATREGTVRGRLFPVLSSGMKLMKGAIESMLRKAEPATEARAATVPLFVDVDAFAAALGILDRTQIEVLLLTPDGSVVERVIGPYTEAAGSALAARLRDLL